MFGANYFGQSYFAQGYAGIIVAPSTTPIHQPSQRWDEQIDVTAQWWEQFKRQPIPITFLPPPPLITPQHSQRFDPLPDYWQEWPWFTAPFTVAWNYQGQRPPTHQLSQRWDPLPDYWQEWPWFIVPPIAAWNQQLGQSPPTHQLSQCWDPLPDYWQGWEAYTTQPASIPHEQPPVDGTTSLIRIVQAVAYNSGGNNTINTFTINFVNVTAGNNLILVLVLDYANTNNPTITDNQSNTYTQDYKITTQGAIFFYRTIASSSGNVTATVVLPGGSTAEVLAGGFEVSGLDPNPVDQTANSTTHSGATFTSGTITTTFAPELVLAAGISNQPITTPPSSPYWVLATSAGGFPKNIILYALPVTQGTFTPTYVCSPSPVQTEGAIISYRGLYIPMRQPPQYSAVLNPIPDYWQEWSAYIAPPIAAWNQQLHTPPPTHQLSQRCWDDLPDYWQEWEAYTQRPYLQFIIYPPPSRQPSQRWDPLLDYTSWWEQFRRWPIPVQPPPPQPPPQRLSELLFYQWFHEVPDYNQQWWEQFLLQPLPGSFFITEEGISRFGASIQVSEEGYCGIENSIAGYNIYVGVGALPDLTQPPTAYSASLPAYVPLTPPVSGTQTYYVLVTAQDHYGLNSQNRRFTSIVLDSSGAQVYSPVAAPVALGVQQLSGGSVKVLATYPGAGSDSAPATSWKIWAGSVLPNPAIDTPVAITPVSGTLLSETIGPFSPGILYVVVGLYRSVDSSLSPTVEGTITIDSPPGEVTPVPSGDQGS